MFNDVTNPCQIQNCTDYAEKYVEKPCYPTKIHDECFTQVLAVQESLEYDMELLCLTGVEDKLQVDVRPTLELLRNAGIRVCTALIF